MHRSPLVKRDRRPAAPSSRLTEQRVLGVGLAWGKTRHPRAGKSLFTYPRFGIDGAVEIKRSAQNGEGS